MKREEILSGLRRHHRMHLSIDPTCSHAPDCAGCIIFDNARSALTREPAPAAGCPHRELHDAASGLLIAMQEACSPGCVSHSGSRCAYCARLLPLMDEVRAALAQPAPATDCENIEPGLSAHGGVWQRCTDREPDDLGTWCDWCRHRGVVQHVDDGSPPFPEPAPGEQHPDDAAVDRFARALKAKLAKKRKQGAGGWETASAEWLNKLLVDHIAKGDPVDVGNLAMMLWNNGQSCAAPGEAGELIDDTRPAGIASFEDHVKAAVRDLNRGAVRWVIRWLQTLKAAPAPAPGEAVRASAVCDPLLWDQQKKCCPDCQHGGPVQAINCEGCGTAGYFAPAAPGKAGEFEITEHVVRAMEPNGLVAIWEGKAPGPLKAGDRLVRYRRRAPQQGGDGR